MGRSLAELRARFTPGTVGLTVRVGDGVSRHEVPALLCGGLAVHPVWEGCPDSTWQITHIASGRLFRTPRLSTERKALLLAVRMARLGDRVGYGELMMADAAIGGRLQAMFARVGPVTMGLR